MKNVNTVQGKETMERFKMEAASEVGVNLKNGYNGDLTSREAGSVGGQMVKKMIEQQEKQMAFCDLEDMQASGKKADRGGRAS